jgi:superfamily II RNA helicase
MTSSKEEPQGAAKSVDSKEEPNGSQSNANPNSQGAEKKSFKGGKRKRSKSSGSSAYPYVKVSPKVNEHLKNIGRPEAQEFIPDPFQLEAMELIKQHDVIVSAPTGSGKTWIAEKAIEGELDQGHRTWYASPLKALSNSKFLEFGKIFGSDKVGLLTGDHKVNTNSPIIVGTTEILRNQLYDSMTELSILNFDLVILDEAHYLADSERGVVWEEIMIYLPSRVRLLLLSATILNADDIAAWLAHNRGTEVKVVQGGERPVPLIPICFRHNEMQLLDTVAKSVKRHGKGGRYGSRFSQGKFDSLDSNQLIQIMFKLNLLPAIFFLKSRANCDHAVSDIKFKSPESWEREEARNVLIDEYLANYPLLEEYHNIPSLRRQGVAAHHAGNLPQFKFLVEELMTGGLLNAIFATSTVSAGVNFPARTVVIPQSDRFNGTSFSNLTATELAQMTGRAGRRGRDMIGFALVLPGPYMNLKLMNGLFNSPPNPVESRLFINFSMTLNLLEAFQYDDVAYILSKSLYSWQRASDKSEASLNRASEINWKSFQKHLKFLQKENFVDASLKLTDDGKTAAKLRFDHPLVYYTALKKRALPESNPALLSAILASLIDEKVNSSYAYKPDNLLSDALETFKSAIKRIINDLREADFDTPYYSMEKGLAIYSWATEGNFTKASLLLGKDYGDLVRLVLMTAEHLNQFSALFQEYPELSETARIAQEILMKPPIV